MQSKLRDRVAASPIARGAAFPLRTMIVARYDAQILGRSVDWLVHSRETTNFTYELDSLNRDQLCWFISTVTGAKIGQVRAWMQELEDDSRPHRTSDKAVVIQSAPEDLCEGAALGATVGMVCDCPCRTAGSRRREGYSPWPGSCVIAAALLRNGHGRLTTIDIDPEAGYLIGEPWASVIDRRTGNSIDLLGALRDVDMFLHDSLHTYDYETKELRLSSRT